MIDYGIMAELLVQIEDESRLMPHLAAPMVAPTSSPTGMERRNAGWVLRRRKKVAVCQYRFDKPMLFVRCKTFIFLNKTRLYWEIPTIVHLKFKKNEYLCSAKRYDSKNIAQRQALHSPHYKTKLSKKVSFGYRRVPLVPKTAKIREFWVPIASSKTRRQGLLINPLRQQEMQKSHVGNAMLVGVGGMVIAQGITNTNSIKQTFSRNLVQICSKFRIEGGEQPKFCANLQ